MQTENLAVPTDGVETGSVSLADRHILLTGSTGFVGKLTLSKILHHYPSATVYLLIRSKADKTPQQRLRDEILSSSLFDDIRDSDVAANIVPIIGDICSDGLGLSVEDRTKLQRSIEVIIHCAANTNFCSPLSTALKINCRGSLRIFDLAKSCDQIKSFIYTSTAFVQSYLSSGSRVSETLPQVPPGIDIESLLLLPDLDQRSKEILKAFPNTYVFSKALAEVELCRRQRDFPIYIVRPTIVGPARFSGWIENGTEQSLASVAIGVGLGLIRSIRGHPDLVWDLVPVDLVAEVLLLAAVTAIQAQQRDQCKIFHCGTSSSNPASSGRIMQACANFFCKRPSRLQLRPPVLSWSTGSIHHFFWQKLPLKMLASIYSVVAVVSGSSERLRASRKLWRTITRVFKLEKQCEFFCNREWIFDDTNLRALIATSEIRRAFHDLPWDDYFDQSCLGIKKFMLHEDVIEVSCGDGILQARQTDGAIFLQTSALSFRSCSCSVRKVMCLGEDRFLLNDIHGELKGGWLCAIMGPSGAGKTTLLNMLALHPSPNTTVRGHLCVQGVPLNDSSFRMYCAYVPQFDSVWSCLTCREMVEFAASFRGMHPNRVVTLLASLGIEGCQHTRCGQLSGGERRRLSLALALVKQPKVLLLDELTSGLDSHAALEMMRVVRRIVHSQEMLAVCTIHQPSERLLTLFDRLILLFKGRAVYQGRISRVLAHFEPIFGQKSPDMDTSEYLLESINTDFGGRDESKIKRMIGEATLAHEAGDSEESTEERFKSDDDEDSSDSVLPKLFRCSGFSQPGFISQVTIHARRQLRLAFRDITMYLGRAVVFAIACGFFAWNYHEARQRTQAQVINRMFLLLWFIGVPSIMAAMSVFAHNLEFQVIRREIRNGMYRPASYLVANTLVQIPMILLLAFCAMGLPAYVGADLDGRKLHQLMGIYSLTLWTFEAFAQLSGVFFTNPLVGTLLYLFYWIFSYLYAGLFLAEENIPWPLKAMVYVTPLRWSMASIVKADFQGAVFDGAVANGTSAYFCPDFGGPCYGYTGDQVLTSVGKIFPLFEPSNTSARDVSMIAALGLGSKALFYVVVYLRSTASVVLSPNA